MVNVSKKMERGRRGLINGKDYFFWFSNSNSLAFVIYLGGTAIMKGFSAKNRK